MKGKYKLLILLLVIVFFGYKQVAKYLIVSYEIKTCFIPVKDGDFSKTEIFCNSIFNYKENPTQENKIIMDSLSSFFEFGNYLNLIDVNEKWGKSHHQFSEEHTIQETQNSQVGFLIDSIQFKDRLPIVCVNSTIPVKPFDIIEADEFVNLKSLTSETKNWPTNHPTIIALRDKICIGEMTDKEKILSILDWMLRNLEHGKEQGTRYGPVKFIEQGFGRCWDFSDLFITLCRASGIPARQVFGVIRQKGGHAWCQVYLKEKGWLSVDPPKKKFGVNNTYVPLSISETGTPTFLYYSMPEITK